MSLTTQSQREFGIATDYDYRVSHKRDRIVVWSGPFYSVFEAEGFSLPNNAGYMLTTYNGDKVRVDCPSPRDSENHEETDRLVSQALTAHYLAIGATKLHPAVTTQSTPITESIPVIVPKRRRSRKVAGEEEAEPYDWTVLRLIGMFIAGMFTAVCIIGLLAAATIDLWWKP